MIVFSTLFGSAIELGLSHLTIAQTFHTRLAAIPVLLVMVKPYAWLRKLGMEHWQVGEEDWIKKAVVDIAVSVIMRVIPYAVVLAHAGADQKQIATACTTVAILSAVIGRPYGVFLEFIRKTFKVTA